MKVTSKVEELFEKQAMLEQLAKKRLAPYPTAFRVAKALNIVNSALRDLKIKRQNIFLQYGKPTEDGKQIKVADENMPLFEAELVKFLALEIEVDIPQISMNQLGMADIEPAILAPLLGWFVFEHDIDPADEQVTGAPKAESAPRPH